MTTQFYKLAAGAAVAALALSTAVITGSNRAVVAADGLPKQSISVSVAASGALEIGAVLPGSPAAKAGLKAGDSILAIDGAALSSGDALVKALAAKKPGDSIVLDVQNRADAKRSVTVVLGDNPNKAGSAYLGVSIGKSRDVERSPWATAPVTQTVVLSVAAGSPADTAGIKAGDVIMAVDGKAITAFADVSNAVLAKKPGDPLSLDVQSGNGPKRTVVVTLGNAQDRAGVAYLGVRLAAPKAVGGGRGNQGRGPVVKSPIVVAEVQPDGPAAKAGIQVGDVIVAMNGTAVADVKALKASIAAAKIGDSLALKITRGSETKTLTATLGENPAAKGKAFLGIGIAPQRMPGNRISPMPGTSG